MTTIANLPSTRTRATPARGMSATEDTITLALSTWLVPASGDHAHRQPRRTGGHRRLRDRQPDPLRSAASPGSQVSHHLGGGLHGADRPDGTAAVLRRPGAASLLGIFLLGVGRHDHGLGWKPELWGGGLVWSALSVLGVAWALTAAPVAAERATHQA